MEWGGEEDTMEVEELFEPKPLMEQQVLQRQRTHESLGKRLYEAAWNNQVGEVSTVIGMGVDVNYSVDGWTALHSAAGHGNLDMVSLLVAHGAVVNAQNFRGETPLFAATYGKHKKVVEFLLKHGAKTDLKDDDGWDAKRWGDEREADDLGAMLEGMGMN